MKKYIFYAVGAVIICVLLIGISGLAAAYIAPEQVKLPAAEKILVPVDVTPGEVVKAEFTVKLPGNMRIAGAEMSGNDITAYPVDANCIRWLWNRREWRLTGKFRVLKEGKISGTQIDFAVRDIFSSRIRGRYSVVLPEITAALPDGTAPEAELQLANTIARPDSRSKWWSWHWLWLLIPLAAAAGYYLFRKLYRRMIVVTPWDAALREIGKLSKKVRKKEYTPEKGMGILCDTLRNYLEVRFALPAPRRTTQEFLKEFQLPADVPEAEQNFFKRFLAAADLIKFAGMRADAAAFAQAAENAEKLVRATAEKEEKKK